MKLHHRFAVLCLVAALISFGVGAASIGGGVAQAADGAAVWKARLAQVKAAPDDVVLTAVGDAIWNKPISPDPDSAVQSLFEMMRGSDITFINFEQTIIAGPVPANGAPAGAELSIIPEFKWAGATMVSMGNNHQSDYGLAGMDAAMRGLDDAGIKHAGTGHNITEAFKATQFEKKGLKIALISALVAPNRLGSDPATATTPGVAQIRGAETRRPDGSIMLSPIDADLKAMETAVREAKKTADVVAVSLHFHWGDLEAIDPGGKQLITHAIIDAGGDVILGHGPHVLNGVEIYKGKPIIYSAGNFVFQQVLAEYRFFPESVKILTPMLADAKQHEALAVRLIMSPKGEFRRFQILPIGLTPEGTPHLVADKPDNEILERLTRLSQPFGTQIKREAWYATVDLAGGK